MHCLKCGTEIEAPQVFCDRCLVDMKNHPVHVKHPWSFPSVRPWIWSGGGSGL